MAKYEEFTDKQQRAMNRVAARATNYKMKIDRLNKALAQPVISFETNQLLRERLAMYRALYKKASAELDDIIRQRDIYKEHLKIAKENLDAAEELKKKWGF